MDHRDSLTKRNARNLGMRSKMADKRDADHRILETVHFAALKHRDQRRKDPEKTPYINHPIGVAYILWKEGGVQDTDVLQVIYRMSRTKTQKRRPKTLWSKTKTHWSKTKTHWSKTKTHRSKVFFLSNIY